ncbi:MAG: hypothetical protein CSA26_07175 [Desulfobacterales bacterium]|nr:MAG: hypothetical protein CSA26_07175 [Desulfobacterales bacterium]
MELLERYLIQLLSFFTYNWIALAILITVMTVFAIKKTKEFFKMVALVALLVGVFYTMLFLEKSMFSGVTSKKKSLNIERRIK